MIRPMSSKLLTVSLLAALVALDSTSRRALAVPIPITNASFEEPAIVPPAGHISHAVPTGWTGNAVNSMTGPGTNFIIRNALTTPTMRFPSIFPNAPVDNQWVQPAMWKTGSAPQNVLSQDLGAANAIAVGTYSFSVYVGFDNTSDGVQANWGGRAAVYSSDGTPLVSLEFLPNTLVPGEFNLYSDSFAVSSGSPVIGTNLVVSLEADRPAEESPLALNVISFDGVTLDFEAGTPVVPGDFDGDGDVDGADFVIWQTNFPTAEGGTLDTGDADGDGDVDGADFVVWQTNFPFTPSPGVAPVPEPNALLLAVAAVAGFAVVRRKSGASRHGA